MLTGPELGAAIEAARIAKGVSKKQLADDFQVKPPSVQGWVKNGRIDKSKLMAVIAYFEDVVGPEHWGLSHHFAFGRPGSEHAPGPEADIDPTPDRDSDIPKKIRLTQTHGEKSAADIVRAMLSKQGKGLSEVARERLLEVAEAEDGGGVLERDYYRPGAVGDEVWIAPTMSVRRWAAGRSHTTIPRCFRTCVSARSICARWVLSSKNTFT